MKQIILTITMLAIALALVIGVIIPLLEHGADTGKTAVIGGQTILPRIEQLLK